MSVCEKFKAGVRDVAWVLLMLTGSTAFAQENSLFQRIANFPVYFNSAQPEKKTSAEIIKTTQDGNTLIYTDSPGEALGFVDITNPEQPQPLGTMALTGEPTSVDVAGNLALVAVNTSPNFVNPSGILAVIDIPTRTVIREIPLGGQPDSVAVSPDNQYAAIAIENERDEEVNVDGVDGGLPQLPAGLLQLIAIQRPVSEWTVDDIELTGLSSYVPSDPEPEFVDINQDNIAAVTLQENNHIVLVDLEKRKVIRDFTAGTNNLTKVDTVKDGVIHLNGSLDDIPREPDAIAWLGNFWVVTANEGDLSGGSRGFSIFSSSGPLRYDSGNTLEHLAVRHGHYPESRSGKKGAEIECVTVARYGDRILIFIGSERGNFVAVYRARLGRGPRLLQLLPTGSGPEGLLAIPERNLLVVAAENDEPGGIRSMITIYRMEQGPPNYPTIVSADDANGVPIAWGALSALAADRTDPDLLFTVHDGFFKNAQFYSIDVGRTPAVITGATPILEKGVALDLNLKGLVQRADDSFWAVSEGNASRDNLLLKLAANGTVLEKVLLPASVMALKKNNGFEGVAVTETDGTERVYVAFQREWAGDPAGFVRIGEYTPSNSEWRFFYYPLDAPSSPAGGWVGLSEIVALDGETFAVVERDNQGGPDAAIKRIYEFSITGLVPETQGNVFPIVTKTLKHDLLPGLRAPNGWVLDKVEGLAVAKDGETYMVTDNDGVDDATGETLFKRLGPYNQLH